MSAGVLAFPAPLSLTRSTTRRMNPNRPMDEAKFEALYRSTARRVWSYLARLTGDPATADDLLQKTYIRFLRANPEGQDDDHLRRYLFRTATNLALDHFREEKRDRGRVIPMPHAPPLPDMGELRHDMMRVFAELKPRERAVIWLAHVEGSDHEEIARSLSVKPGSVRVLLFRARKRLAELLSRKGLAPGATS